MDDNPTNFFENKYTEPNKAVDYKLFIIGAVCLVVIIALTAVFFIFKNQSHNKSGGKEPANNAAIAALDSDGDGLDDNLEKIYGTDPFTPDTDKDGYGDKTEINNGYNPLGEGKLKGDVQGGIPADNNPGGVFSGLAVEKIFIGDDEAELVRLVNEYRKSQNLPPVMLSKSPTYVAKMHALDMVENVADQYGKYDMHSWSDAVNWISCSRPMDHNALTTSDLDCMHQKPIELTDYVGEGHENAGGYRDPTRRFRSVSPDGILQDWKESYGHNILMINKDIWKNYSWNAIGVAIYKGFACIWFGENTDELGAPLADNDCGEIGNPYYKDECYFKKAIKENDLKICENISDKKYREICPLRTEIYRCVKVKLKEAENNCYHALEDQDERYCELLYTVKDEVEYCILVTAERKNDRSICEKITSPTLKQECIVSTSR